MDVTLDAMIDPDVATPPYVQLKHTLSGRILDGSYAAGDRLPPVRRCAEALDLAPNTVARAYRELEQEGLLITRGRAGTFVADVVPLSREARAAAEAAAHDLVDRLRALGFGDAAIGGLVSAALLR